MIIRSFVAPSAAAALKNVRSEMGGDAVVLKTTQTTEQNGKEMIEVTACLDNPTAAQASKVLLDKKTRLDKSTISDTTPRATTELSVQEGQQELSTADSKETATLTIESRLDAIEAKLDLLLSTDIADTSVAVPESKVLVAAAAMRKADVPELYIASFFDALRDKFGEEQITEKTIHDELVSRIESLVEPGLSFQAGNRLVFIGPAGSGKTSVVGKLASQLVVEQKTAVTLVTLDSYKVGALDEIASYSDLLGVDLTEASDVAARSSHRDKVVLIDTGAFPWETGETVRVREQLDHMEPTHRFVVFSALTRSSDIESIALSAMQLQPTHLVFTMTDLSDCWGAALAAAEATGIRIGLITNSPSGTGRVESPNASAIAARILGAEEQDG
ncbi:MAG: hypothetical protein DRP45_05310 [Candidatus Zixiibacteriota bacterium]|nr:MAG: hypothetical protein DRP45_05310 [candidate division Zixibacteria bacterium]